MRMNKKMKPTRLNHQKKIIMRKRRKRRRLKKLKRLKKKRKKRKDLLILQLMQLKEQLILLKAFLDLKVKMKVKVLKMKKTMLKMSLTMRTTQMPKMRINFLFLIFH